MGWRLIIRLMITLPLSRLQWLLSVLLGALTCLRRVLGRCRLSCAKWMSPSFWARGTGMCLKYRIREGGDASRTMPPCMSGPQEAASVLAIMMQAPKQLLYLQGPPPAAEYLIDPEHPSACPTESSSHATKRITSYRFIPAPKDSFVLSLQRLPY